MWPEAVVIADIFPYTGAQLFWGRVLVYVDVFGFETAKPALYDDVIHPTSLAVHALPNAQRAQVFFVFGAGELASLVGIDDGGDAVSADRLPERL